MEHLPWSGLVLLYQLAKKNISAPKDFFGSDKRFRSRSLQLFFIGDPPMFRNPSIAFRGAEHQTFLWTALRSAWRNDRGFLEARLARAEAEEDLARQLCRHDARHAGGIEAGRGFDQVHADDVESGQVEERLS